MSSKVKELLQRINFVETDMEMQKQILFSIPADSKQEIETVVGKIAGLKNQIEELRNEIKLADKDEYKRMMAIEEGTRQFQQFSRDKKFRQVNTLNDTGECFIVLNDGTRIDCLVAAKEENGNVSVLTIDGQAKQFPKGLVKQGGEF